jgi:hypothetical protein
MRAVRRAAGTGARPSRLRRIAEPTDVQKLADAIGDDYRAMALLAAELELR